MSKGLFRQALASFRLCLSSLFIQMFHAGCQIARALHPLISKMYIYLLFIFLFASLIVQPVFAQGHDDTRRLLEHRRERAAAERERERLDGALSDGSGQQPMLIVDGQPYIVERTASALGQALYLSLQQHAWSAAQSFLDEYSKLAERDPLLVHYAQGLLARSRGQLNQAEVELRALLARQPDFLPGRLELARVLFETAQEQEATSMFSNVRTELGASGSKTEGVRKTIDIYLNALEQRRAWRGAISLVVNWSDNVNRSSESRICLMPGGNGVCYVERTLPARIKAAGSVTEASIQKRFPLKGHHGLYLRTRAYGTWYQDTTRYNETRLSALVGYSYRDARKQFGLGPGYTYQEWGRHALYGAWGLHADWQYRFAPQSLAKLEVDYQKQRYRQSAYARHFNGPERALDASYFREIGVGWTLSGGVDVESSGAKERVNAYRQQGIRLGASLESRGYVASLNASYKRRRYDAHNPLIEARRLDHEQSYTAVLTATRWKTGGFVPSLTLRHNKVSSNVAWLHAYHRNEIGLRVEYAI